MWSAGCWIYREERILRGEGCRYFRLLYAHPLTESDSSTGSSSSSDAIGPKWLTSDWKMENNRQITRLYVFECMGYSKLLFPWITHIGHITGCIQRFILGVWGTHNCELCNWKPITCYHLHIFLCLNDWRWSLWFADDGWTTNEIWKTFKTCTLVFFVPKPVHFWRRYEIPEYFAGISHFK